MFAYDDVRDNVIRFGPVHDIARARVQAGDQGQYLFQLVFLEPAAAQQLCVVPVAKQMQELGNHQSRLAQPGGIRWQLVELNQQAFLEIPSEHAGRVEVLQAVEYRFHFVQFQRIFFGFVQQPCVNVLDVRRQVAALIHGIQQRVGNGLIPLAQGRQVQLPLEVILQGFGGRITSLEIRFVLVFALAGRSRGRLVDVIPGGINRQIIRNVVRNIVLGRPVWAVLGFVPVRARVLVAVVLGGLRAGSFAVLVLFAFVAFSVLIVLGGFQHGV